MQSGRLVNPNPVLAKGFKTLATSTGHMTVEGTINKIALLLIVLVASAALGWRFVTGGLILVTLLSALGVALWCTLRPRMASKLAPVYAVLQGLTVGAISRYYNEAFDGIVLQAAGLTVAILAALLFVYRTGLIKVTQNFRLAVAAGTLGVFVYYMAGLGASFFGFEVPLIWSNSNYGILFSVLVVVLAYANLVVDFDFIEKGTEARAPKYMEWYGAFGLLVSLIWLYLELLRLLAKLQSRR